MNVEVMHISPREGEVFASEKTMKTLDETLEELRNWKDDTLVKGIKVIVDPNIPKNVLVVWDATVFSGYLMKVRIHPLLHEYGRLMVKEEYKVGTLVASYTPESQADIENMDWGERHGTI